MSTVIKVENLSKQYRLGTVGTGALAHDINRWWYRIRGKEDPYLKIGEANDRTQKGNSDYVWALRDINFEVQHGEVLGIIGRNGAGKSTLLKILSRTTAPTTGSVKIKGRVASLLEVGTGFHPELTGRENIFLNGAILGMTKKEIARKFDEIVDFAGVERYIDTPVKRYSSGMYVRLAFAVAAHLEPEILIVDEVLAVGDAEFQKKALGKMKDVSNKEGRTVLFVSHNLSAINSLCNKGLLLQNGRVQMMGNVDKVLNAYQLSGKKLMSELNLEKRFGTGSIKIADIELISSHETGLIASGSALDIVFVYEAEELDPEAVYEFALGIWNAFERPMFMATNLYKKYPIRLQHKKGKVVIRIPKLPLHTGLYSMNLAIRKDGIDQDFLEEGKTFQVAVSDFFQTGFLYHAEYDGFYTDFDIIVES
ncbi:MAG: ABC transporter ATP-binding protein [Lacibacter sp.]